LRRIAGDRDRPGFPLGDAGGRGATPAMLETSINNEEHEEHEHKQEQVLVVPMPFTRGEVTKQASLVFPRARCFRCGSTAFSTMKFLRRQHRLTCAPNADGGSIVEFRLSMN
jgi:hypothetical protein